MEINLSQHRTAGLCPKCGIRLYRVGAHDKGAPHILYCSHCGPGPIRTKTVAHVSAIADSHFSSGETGAYPLVGLTVTDAPKIPQRGQERSGLEEARRSPVGHLGGSASVTHVGPPATK